MENSENSEFLKQFGGSATANLVFCIGMIVYKFIEGRCKHSKCSSNTSIFKCSADNYETERASSAPKIKEDGLQFEESVQELPTSKHKEVQTRHLKVDQFELRDPESPDHTRDFSMVKGPELV